MTVKVERLTQSQRSARTRERLIEAAVESLYSYGYAATSTTLVAERAGVSRGAMLHQFPSKVDLMHATAKSTFVADLAAYRLALASKTSARDKLVTLLEVAWSRFSSPGGVAQTEIWLATRSDPELAAIILPLHDEMTANTQSAQAALFKGAGMTDTTVSDAFMTLNVSALRGLAIERALGTRDEVIDRAFALLRGYMIATIDAAGGKA
jgi:AcrR family transcriptional regulator